MTSMQQNLKHQVRRIFFTPVGHLFGAPTVHITSPLTRGGNYLYYWMWAYKRDSKRHPVRVLFHEVIKDWLPEFPLIDHLSIRREDASTLWSNFLGDHKHTYGVSFSSEDVDGFCKALVDSSPSFQTRLEVAKELVKPETVVLNVRRGDYYTYPHITAMYGLDIEEYVRRAVVILQEKGRSVDDVLIVSDDTTWCLEHLSSLLPGSIRTIPERKSMFDDLAVLASAKTLLLANSTFSYWGGYLAAALQTDHMAIVPDYHYVEDGMKMRDPYDPRWVVAE